MTIAADEINFDGLVGPTHNYAGLSEGNLASARNKDAVAKPREAALQGLAKMRRLVGLGLKQGMFAPMERPNLRWLRSLGFAGTDAQVWEAAVRADPRLARNALAASSMWAANAATVSPSADTADGRLHLSVANLVTMAHRAQEQHHTQRLLERMFPDKARFAVHPALPSHAVFADEGAANHMRLSAAPGTPGVEIFIYGRGGFESQGGRFPARQTLEACEAIARRHGLRDGATFFWLQALEAIDSGAFHNDVVAVAHGDTVFCHEQAFADLAGAKGALARAADGLFEPRWAVVPMAAVGLSDVITSYLFNSQLVTLPGANRKTLIAPAEAKETPAVWSALQAMIGEGGPIGGVEVVDVRESMRNGGGPGCLRLRVEATHDEQAAMRQGFLWTEALGRALEAWVAKHYRAEIAPADFADPALINEVRTALDALTQILPLGQNFYSFQR